MKPIKSKDGKASPSESKPAQPGMAVTLGGAPLSDMQADTVKDIEMGGSGEIGNSQPTEKVDKIRQPSDGTQVVEELEVNGEIPQARFGHTITIVSKAKVVLFGGATGDTGKYSMTGETYMYNILNKAWQKLQGKLDID